MPNAYLPLLCQPPMSSPIPFVLPLRCGAIFSAWQMRKRQLHHEACSLFLKPPPNWSVYSLETMKSNLVFISLCVCVYANCEVGSCGKWVCGACIQNLKFPCSVGRSSRTERMSSSSVADRAKAKRVRWMGGNRRRREPTMGLVSVPGSRVCLSGSLLPQQFGFLRGT